MVNGKPYVSAKLYYDTRTGMTDPLRGDIFLKFVSVFLFAVIKKFYDFCRIFYPTHGKFI